MHLTNMWYMHAAKLISINILALYTRLVQDIFLPEAKDKMMSPPLLKCIRVKSYTETGNRTLSSTALVVSKSLPPNES